MTCEFYARLIGKREINLIARLYLLQIFLKNVQITLYSLVVLNLHERRLHIGKAAQAGCNLRNRTRNRSTQREGCGKLTPGNGGGRNAHLGELLADADEVGVGHMILLGSLLRILLDASSCPVQQFLSLQVGKCQFALLAGRIIFALQTDHIGIFNQSHNLSAFHILSFLYIDSLHYAPHERSHIALVLGAQNELTVGCNRSIHHTVNRLAHLQIYSIYLFLRERNVVEIHLFMFMLMSVSGSMSLCSGVV